LPQELINELRAENFPIIESFLSSSVKMKESHRAQKPLIHFSPRHKLTQQFNDLYDVLEGDGGLN
jgi:chromosome partitioning protein